MTDAAGKQVNHKWYDSKWKSPFWSTNLTNKTIKSCLLQTNHWQKLKSKPKQVIKYSKRISTRRRNRFVNCIRRQIHMENKSLRENTLFQPKINIRDQKKNRITKETHFVPGHYVNKHMKNLITPTRQPLELSNTCLTGHFSKLTSRTHGPKPGNRQSLLTHATVVTNGAYQCIINSANP